MNPDFFETLGFETLGWLIVHSAWQFLMVGLLAWLLGDIVLRRCSASIRYTLFVIAMIAMVACPALTWAWLDQPAKTAVKLPLAQQADTEFADAAALDLGTNPTDENPTDDAAVELSFGLAAPLEQSVARTELNARSLSVIITPWLDAIVGCWLLGVCILASRLAVGWWRVERLKHAGFEPEDDLMGRALVAAFERVKRKLDVRRKVRLLVSQWIDSPVVVGAMHSVVLVPANVLGGLALEHVEAILAHELAHVRRYDFLVNLLQSIVETIFFYHPAVWWVSHRMRTLREHCCDDMAATAIGSPAVYGRALLAIEELRQANLSPALGIRDGDLVSRVRRLLDRSTSRDSIVPSGPIVATVIASLSLAAWLGVVSLRADEPVDAKESPEAFIASVSEEPVPGPAEDSVSIARPAPDPKAQHLGEQIHQQLTAVSNLPAFLISTRRCNSFYGNPDGVIGLQDEQSLENLKSALQVRKFDESLSTQTDTWAWKDNQVVVMEHHDYVYEGNSHYHRSAGTWDGQRGWRRDSVGQFGRYRSFSETFKNHFLRPNNYLYLGDHRFKWATVDEYPSFFVNSAQSVKFANYQSLPDEDFAGERCFVIRSIPRREQFWISKESGKLLGCLTFINQGRSIPIHEMESLRQLAGQKFESRDAAWQWVKEVASYDQRQQLEADWHYLNRDVQHPHDLTIFQDYREVAPGIELPHTEWYALCSSEGDKFRYDVRRIEIERVTTQPDLTPLMERALPTKGDTVNDWRFSTWVKYEFDPEMAVSTIHAMVDKAQTKLLESQRAIDSILKPLKAMVGQPAPKLNGQSITGTELPEVASGSRTLIHFWAVWCGPCKNDIPILTQLAKNGLNVIGVHAPGTPREEIEAVIKETGLNYPVILGAEGKSDSREPGTISGYPVGMFPCCVLIDKDGNVVAVGSLDDVLRSGR